MEEVFEMYFLEKELLVLHLDILVGLEVQMMDHLAVYLELP